MGSTTADTAADGISMGRSGRKPEPVWTMVTPVIYGLLIPFTGTSLGAACVFFLKNGLGDRVQRG